MGKLAELERALKDELTGNILPFWSRRMRDDARGGFCGRISGEGVPDPDAPRGAVMYARILWTFSAAYRILGNNEYLETATRAKNYILEHFYDPVFGGIYWSLDADGRPLDTKKQFYALGFAVYGLSEYHRATGDPQALEYAVKLFETIEEHSWEPVYGGYTEAAARDWGPAGDIRLSEKETSDRKTMNTHLHIIEPYANLLGVWPDDRLRRSTARLLDIFTDKIFRPESGHLGLFFDDEWNETMPGTFSYGHDIEASWLLLEAAIGLGDEAVAGRVKEACARIADAAMEGRMPDGSMVYERHSDGRVDEDRHWWVQAECVVGLFWLWHYHGRNDALDKCLHTWDYISNNLVDRRQEEWFWSIGRDGIPNRREDKAGFWKCPYHNGRMCLELIGKIRSLNVSQKP